jgi:hypothetical protein
MQRTQVDRGDYIRRVCFARSLRHRAWTFASGQGIHQMRASERVTLIYTKNTRFLPSASSIRIHVLDQQRVEQSSPTARAAPLRLPLINQHTARLSQPR